MFVTKAYAERLETRLRVYEAREEERYKLEQQKIEEIQKSCADATPCVDWRAINAFSIERIYNKTENQAQTVIGYILATKDDRITKEWYIFCNEEHHEKLVEDFKDYIETRKNLF
jgi:predicted Zn-dependent peptidase